MASGMFRVGRRRRPGDGPGMHSSDGTKRTARVVPGRVEAQVEAQQQKGHRRAQHVDGPR